MLIFFFFLSFKQFGLNFEFKNKLLLEFIDTYTKPRIKIQESFMTAIRGELSSLISTVKSFSD